MARKRRYGLDRPAWAAIPLDALIYEIKPVEGWVMIQEHFDQDRHVTVAGIELEIATLGTSNTTYGIVRGIHDNTASEIGVSVGDEVIYRQWAGGRWQVQNDVVLIMKSKDVIGKVE